MRLRGKPPNQFTSTTYKLAKMNLAVRGLSANLGNAAADTFFKDQRPDSAWSGTNYIMANPPFNLKDWRAADEFVHDGRWNGYDTPPTGPARRGTNYVWILHMVSKLSDWSGATETTLRGCPEGERGGAHQYGVDELVLANGPMPTSTKGEGAIRQKMIENDLVDCMIALPGQLFFTTQIPVCIWILSKNKNGAAQSPSSPALLPEGEGGQKLRDRRGETLFIDARKIGSMISRTQKELTPDDILQIGTTYHRWKGASANDECSVMNDELSETHNSSLSTHNSTSSYQDIAGFCKSATKEEVAKHDYVLTPGRYVGAAPLEDDGIPFETKMTEVSQTLYGQMAESAKLDEVIRKNLKGLGYGK